MRTIDYLPFVKYFFHKGAPAEITMFVTNKCNALCSHCFYHRELNQKQEPLSPAEIGRVFSSLPRLLRVIFSGGEPFSRRDLAEVMEEITKATKVFHITIPTNGTLTRQTVDTLTRALPRCPETFVNVSFSLDELHGRRDDILRLKNSFARMMETWGALKALQAAHKNLILGVIITQTKSNEANLDEIYSYAKDVMAADNIAFSLIRTESYIPEELEVDILKYRALTERIKRDNYRANFTFSRLFLKKRSLLYDTVQEIHVGDKFLFPCQSGKIRLVMSPTGDLFPCEEYMLSGDPQKSFGNIKHYGYDFGALYRSESHRRLTTSIVENRCFCRHECDLTTNIFFNPRLFLRLLRTSPGPSRPEAPVIHS